MDALPNPIYYKDVKGDFIRCNSRFSELTNTCKREIIGKSAYEFFPKSAADRNKLIDKQIMKTLKPYEDEVHFIKDDGEVRYYKLSKAVCQNRDCVVEGIVCIMTDITDRIKEKEILIQQSKFAEMGEMIASIAHQWNEPKVQGEVFVAFEQPFDHRQSTFGDGIAAAAFVSRNTINARCDSRAATNEFAGFIDDHRVENQIAQTLHAAGSGHGKEGEGAQRKKQEHGEKVHNQNKVSSEGFEPADRSSVGSHHAQILRPFSGSLPVPERFKAGSIQPRE